MFEGMSIAEVCRELGVNWQAFNDYRLKYPEFSLAIKNGEFASRGWWEGEGRKNIDNKEFNSGLWYMNMKNRFGWRDKPEEEPDRPAFDGREYVE